MQGSFSIPGPVGRGLSSWHGISSASGAAAYGAGDAVEEQVDLAGVVGDVLADVEPEAAEDGALVYAELLRYGGEVEEVPSVVHFAVAEVHEGGAGEGDLLLRGSEAEAIAGVDGGGGPAAGDVVAFDDLFVNGDVDVGEGAVELAIGFLELFVGERGGG